MSNKKHSILIVDDSPVIIMELSKILGTDYEILSEIDANNVIETAEKLKPDLILLDIVMPEQDGYTAIASLKNHDATKDIPVIFITGLSDIISEERGLSWGAVDYITKPFSSMIVELRVQNQLKIMEQLKEIDNTNKLIAEKSELLSNMFDQIDVPINEITELLNKALEQDFEKNAKEYFNNILCNTTAMSRIIDKAKDRFDELKS